jgi:UDP-N-acetylmuramoyl-tripeptide--D-alanyl-D-alanine ligase
VHLSASELAAMVHGRVVGDSSAVSSSYVNDSRRVVRGACFVALRDARDGHDFVGDALARGASTALVERDPVREALPSSTALVVVEDTVAALATAASAVRDRLVDVTVVGITGSTGKTSTKDLLAGALPPARRVHAAVESYNNEVGLPLTILATPEDAGVVIAEMGARSAGNITELAAVAQPSVGVVTGIGTAHAEHLGGIEGVARVKGELLETLPSDGVAVLDADDPWTPSLAARSAAPVVLVGRGASVTCRLVSVDLDDELFARVVVDTPAGSVAARLGLRGEHQAANALFAVAVGWWLGVAPDEISAGLSTARGSAQRMELRTSTSGVRVLDDSYNANPTSMAAALRALARLPVSGRRVAVLGEMRELGPQSDELHAEIGGLVVEAGVDHLVAVGPGGSAIAAGTDEKVRVTEVADAGEAVDALAELVAGGDAVLVKASRAVGLERVADAVAPRSSRPARVPAPESAAAQAPGGSP